MKSRILVPGDMSACEKTHVLIFDTGDEVAEELLRFAREKKPHSARFTAIGAFSKVTLGYFDWEKKDYIQIPVDEQVECVSCMGDVACKAFEASSSATCVRIGMAQRRMVKRRITKIATTIQFRCMVAHN